MKQSVSLWLLASLLLATCVQAQQPKVMQRIGYLSTTSQSAMADRVDAFKLGLRELGYVERQNLVVEWRYAEDKPDRLREMAADLARLKVDIIVTGGNSATEAAKKATGTIPIVMTRSSDPVASGFVASLARPGRNITGLAALGPELAGKRLELLKEIVPKLSRVAVFGTSATPGNALEFKEAGRAGEALKLQLQYVDVLSVAGMQPAFQAAAKGRVDAVLSMLGGPVLRTPDQREAIAELAVNYRLPVSYESARSVVAGGLMSYGGNLLDSDRYAATYVDKLLKGRTPADLPVEQPTKFEFVINLKAAKQIGLTIPPNVLARATRVIR